MKTKELILNLLNESKQSLSPKEIASKVNKSDGSVRFMLNRLLKEGLIKKVSYGCYVSVSKSVSENNVSVSKSVSNLESVSKSVNIEELGIETKKNYHKKYHKEYQIKNKDRVNKYQREWRQKNKERVKEYEKRYWEKRALKESKDDL